MGELGLAAKETIPILEDLRKYKSVAVSAKASMAFETIQDEIKGAEIKTKDPISYKDRQTLQGTWKPLSFVATGIPPRKPENNAAITFISGRIRIDVENLHKGGRYHLNASKHPKEIDLLDSQGNDNLFGVYSLEGNTISICLGKTRPKSLSIENEEFAVLLVLEKQGKEN